MENVSSATYINRALQEYNSIQIELNRPQEDLVMIAACELVKKSIADFLHAFLQTHGQMEILKDDLLTLQDACIEINDDFKILDLSSLALLSEEFSMGYTNDLESDRLKRYIKTLEKTKELVFELI